MTIVCALSFYLVLLVTRYIPELSSENLQPARLAEFRQYILSTGRNRDVESDFVQWRTVMPKTVGCAYGVMTWNQTESAKRMNAGNSEMIAPVLITLTRTGNSRVTEKGIGRNINVSTSILSSNISAGLGTQSINFAYKGKVICEWWKFGRKSKGFFTSHN